ncbi:hypothetical protein [Deinococcus sp.]
MLCTLKKGQSPQTRSEFQQHDLSPWSALPVPRSSTAWPWSAA